MPPSGNYSPFLTGRTCGIKPRDLALQEGIADLLHATKHQDIAEIWF
jgi:hypothetical protein